MGSIFGPEWAPKLVKTCSFFGACFLIFFTDFEHHGGCPRVSRRSTLSEEVPRAASRAVLLTNYQHQTSANYQASNGSNTPWPKGRRIFGILAKRAQDGAQVAQEGAKMVQDRPKTGLRWPKIGPRQPKIGSKQPKTGPRQRQDVPR